MLIKTTMVTALRPLHCPFSPSPEKFLHLADRRHHHRRHLHHYHNQNQGEHDGAEEEEDDSSTNDDAHHHDRRRNNRGFLVQRGRRQQPYHHYQHAPERRNILRPRSSVPLCWPLRLTRIERPERLRYNPAIGNRGGGRHAAARFLQQRWREDGHAAVDAAAAAGGGGGVLHVSVRRRSVLAGLLAVGLLPFLVADELMLLPVGIVAYAAALTVAWEQWTDEVQADRAARQEQDGRRRMREFAEVELRGAIARAEFEYHILRKQPHVRIVPVRRRSYEGDYDDEMIVLYAA